MDNTIRQFYTHYFDFNTLDYEVKIDGVPVNATVTLQVFDPKGMGDTCEVELMDIYGDITVGDDDDAVELSRKVGGLYHHAEAAILAWLRTEEGHRTIGDAALCYYEDCWERQNAPY